MKADKKASKNTFSVIFVIQKGKCRPDGKAPIVARITVNGEMVHFSTKMYIEPERWLPLEYKTKGQTHEEQVINSTLFDFHATIKRKYNDMIYRGEVITASKIKSSILCQDERSMTLIALCNKYIEDYEKLVLEITTDGSIHPKEALKEAAKILIYHFMLFSDEKITIETTETDGNEEFDEEVLHMRQLLKSKLVDMDLSVRALNCLKSAEVETLGELVQFNKTDLLKFRNFGKKSLTELDDLLASLNLSFGMDISKYKLDKE